MISESGADRVGPLGATASTNETRLALVWRIVAVFVAVVLIWRGLGWLTQTFGPPAPDQFGQNDRQGHATRAILATVLTVPLIWLARRYLDRRPWESLGVATMYTAWRQMLAGMGLWFAAAALGAVVALTIGGVQVDITGPLSRELLLLAVGLPVLVFLYEALPEELIFRGYFYRNLAGSLPRWQAVVVQAALFTLWGAAIGAAGSAERLVIFFTFSVALGILRVLTGTIWAGVGYHVAFQWVAQWLGAATSAGFLHVSGTSVFEALTFGLFPMALLSVVIVNWPRRTSRVDWHENEPDPLAFANGSGSDDIDHAGEATRPSPTSS